MAILESTSTTRPLIISSDTLRGDGDPVARTPPGQTLTKKWPVLHYGGAPEIDLETWELKVWGLCENPYTLTYHELLQLPQVDVKCDIHCVTHWSRLDNVFTGVQIKSLIELAKPKSGAKFVMQHAASAPGDDWTTNLPLEVFTDEDCILCHHHDGQPLGLDHGFPVRAIVPKLYFWKGAKWISGLELRETDAPGFWEVNGYHMHGDPWREERFGW
ncbi:MAG: sulfite oxidase-like oxidoreductase [Planctomycetota bacterium]|nr:sulfite oxidase-like oxidoreductase [Planctomycetota bacterium]